MSGFPEYGQEIIYSSSAITVKGIKEWATRKFFFGSEIVTKQSIITLKMFLN